MIPRTRRARPTPRPIPSPRPRPPLLLGAALATAALGLAWLVSAGMPLGPERSAPRDAANAPPAGVSRAHALQAPGIDPSWRVGETFTVRYEVPEAIRGQGDDRRVLGEPRRVDVAHTIVADWIEDGRRRLAIEARALGDAAPGGAGDEALRLTLDAETRALVEVLETYGPRGEAVVANPFAGDAPEAVLFVPRRFPDRILDRPAIPPGLGLGQERTRDVALDPAWYPAFQQALRVDAEGVLTVSLQREDAATGRTHRVIQRWAPGALWWSEAEARLGGTLLLSARLLPPAPAARAYLPALARDAAPGGD